MYRYNIFVLFLILFIAANHFSFAEVLAIDSPTVIVPDKMIEMLTNNSSKITPISLVWQQSRASDIDYKKLLTTLSLNYAYGFKEDRLGTLMWQNGKGYLFLREKTVMYSNHSDRPFAYETDQYELLESFKEMAIDENYYYYGSGKDVAQPFIGIWPLEKRIKEASNRGLFPQFYTICLGFKFPFFGKELTENPCSYILYLIKHGEVLEVREETIDQTKCTLVRIKSNCIFDGHGDVDRVLSFWLLPNYGYAVKKIVVDSVDNKKCYVINNSQFLLIPNSTLFLPKKTIVEYYTYFTIPDKTIFEKPLFIDTYMLLDSSTQKINEKMFSINNKYNTPGTRITDRVLQDTEYGVSYTIPANPADLDRVIEAALSGKDFTPTPLPSTAAIVIKWLLCIAGIAMILYAGYKKFIKKT